VILGHATFLQEVATPEQAPDLDIIVKSSLRLKEIIEEFANVDHFEHGLSRLRRASVVINQVVLEVVNSLKEMSIQREITIALEAPKIPSAYRGMPPRLPWRCARCLKTPSPFPTRVAR